MSNNKPDNGKTVPFPQQPPEPTDEQMAQQKRIQVAAQNAFAAMSGLTIMEATGALKTIEGMLNQHMANFMQTEKLEAPGEENTTETGV